jgi:hypothetical protein
MSVSELKVKIGAEVFKGSGTCWNDTGSMKEDLKAFRQDYTDLLCSHPYLIAATTVIFLFKMCEDRETRLKLRRNLKFFKVVWPLSLGEEV